MVKSPEKKLRRQRWKIEKRRMRRRYAVLDTLPFPDAPMLLRMEPFFTHKDSFDLVHGSLPRAKQIAQELGEFATVLNEDLVDPVAALPDRPLLEIPSPTRMRMLKIQFPMGLFNGDSFPGRLYEHKVRSGQLCRAAGQWVALRHCHLLYLTNDQCILGRLRRSEYLVRANGEWIEIFSLGYRPLFCYRTSQDLPR